MLTAEQLNRSRKAREYLVEAYARGDANAVAAFRAALRFALGTEPLPAWAQPKKPGRKSNAERAKLAARATA
ncbi:hypothetical protein PQR53_08435 [Paraburkholderia fungorum]|uniref:hypothetical protein n=1 Tax=Paraburkholderia fungorum TaxID=134537 RepID=UPI0038BBAF1F